MSGPADTDVDQFLHLEFALMRTAKSVRRAFDKAFAELGLNMSQASMVTTLVRTGPLAQTELAACLDIGKAAVGSAVDHLERRGLVERRPDPADRRVWKVAATGQARAVSAAIAAIDDRVRRQLRHGTSGDERSDAAALLNRLHANLSE